MDDIIVRYEKEKGIDVKVTYVRLTDYEAKLNSVVSLKRDFIDLPAIGCAIVTLEGDQIHSCLVKGVNDYDLSTVVPYVQVCGSSCPGRSAGGPV